MDNKIVETLVILFVLFQNCLSLKYDTIQVTDNRLPRNSSRYAIGYDYANDTILLFGGEGYRYAFVSFKDNIFTDHGENWLNTNANGARVSSGALGYTQIGKYLYMIEYVYPNMIKFDTETRTATYPALPVDIPIPVEYHGCLTHLDNGKNKYLFVIGGNYNGEQYKAFQIFNLSSNSWITQTGVPNMKEQRAQFGCTVKDNYVYAIGGTWVNTIERLFVGDDLINIQSQEWQYINGTVGGAIQMSSLSGVVINGDDIVVIGGEAPNIVERNPNITVIDTVALNVYVGGVQARPTSVGASIIVHNKLYIFGGKKCQPCIGSKQIDTYQYANLLTSNPTQVPTSNPTSNPTSVPTTSNPTTSNPTTTIPTTSNPTTSNPTTSTPTTSNPTTFAPTTAIPTTAIPTTSVPTTSVPTTSEPTTSIPTTSLPTTSNPTTYEPTTSTPTTTDPTPVDPTTNRPTTSHPTTYTPTTFIPTTSTPTTNVPTTYAPTTSIPTTNTPTTNPTKPDDGMVGSVQSTQTGNRFSSNDNESFLVKNMLLIIIAVATLSIICIIGFVLYCCMNKKKKQNKSTSDRNNIELEPLERVQSVQSLSTISPEKTDVSGVTDDNMPNETGEIELIDPFSNEHTLKVFLTNLELSEYYNLFVAEGFGAKLSMLYELNDYDLKQIGIKKMADRKAILKQIHLTKQKDDNYVRNDKIDDVESDDSNNSGLFAQPSTNDGGEDDIVTSMGNDKDNDDDDNDGTDELLYKKGTKQTKGATTTGH